jgi:hypothetical protein
MFAISNAGGLDNSKPLRIWLDADASQIDALTHAVYAAIGGADVIRQKYSLAIRHLKLVLLNLLSIAGKDRARYCSYYRTSNAYSSRSRYNPLKISIGLVEVIDALYAADMIEHHIGFFDRNTCMGRVSRMRATDKLLAMVEIEQADFPALLKCHTDTEDIILRPAKVGGKKQKDLEYEDTPKSHRMRAILGQYNALLERTDLRLDISPVEASAYGIDLDDLLTDPASKRVQRIFNDSCFNLGGRFYGGWWETIPSELRARILIHGRSTVEPDFSALHIRLLYALEGIDYDAEIIGDPYHLAGYEQSVRMRKVLKQAILIAVNAKSFESGLRAFRNKLVEKREEFDWVFDEEIDRKDLLQAMIDKHHVIGHHLFNGRGKYLQFIDSQITELLLIRAMDQGIVVLPVHDSYIVESEHEAYIEQEMDRCFWEIVSAIGGNEDNVNNYQNDSLDAFSY